MIVDKGMESLDVLCKVGNFINDYVVWEVIENILFIKVGENCI